uniref:Uncharacterized protein n=1 Tax=Cacopsylla melanoneura TaxID=428564 RepID=A0A8D8SZ04_9HEMI
MVDIIILDTYLIHSYQRSTPGSKVRNWVYSQSISNDWAYEWNCSDLQRINISVCLLVYLLPTQYSHVSNHTFLWRQMITLYSITFSRSLNPFMRCGLFVDISPFCL